jgi:hypothetical protein
MKRSIIVTAIIVVGILSIGLLIAGSTSSATGTLPQRLDFVVPLSAAPGVTTSASGLATFQLNPNTHSISYTLRVSNLQNVFMAHIHLSATGAILIWLYPNPNTVASGGEKACLAVLSGGPITSCPGYKAGKFSGVLAQGTITSADLSGSTTCYGCLGVTFNALVSDLEAGEAYVNVHTAQNPGGELAGTIPGAPPHPEHPTFQFDSSLVGSYPGITVAGIPSGGAPWTLTTGHVSISPNGVLSADVDGLVLYGTGTSLDGTTGPVTKVFASLVCASSSGPSLVNTNAVPLSPMGNAQINQNIPIPSTCFAPQVLIRIAATTSGPISNGPWIAATGLMTN